MLSFVLALLIGAAAGLTPAQWRSQSVYQVITDRFALTSGSTTAPCNWGSYCGGTWQGLINKLDYIKGMGFTAVWISPVIKNIAGGTPYGDPYHGYWPQDLYSLNSAFGTAADLKALSTALHSRGMYLMIDTVANHMAYNGAPANVKWTNYNPFNSSQYYHSYCPVDNSNITSVRNCWVGDTVVSLPDLKTEDATVQAKFNEWIPQLVQNYSIDGLRLDSAMQVNQDFWPSFIQASGVYAIGEVFDGNPATLCTYQNYMPGMLNYAAYFWLLRAFQSTSATMTELANNLSWLNSTCKDTTLLGSFMENHDNPRFASITNDTGLTKNAIAFTLLNDGLPIIYYGQEQGFSGAIDPYNREPLWTSGYNTQAPMYTHIAKLNAARSTAIARDPTYVTSKSNIIYSDTNTLVTSKGAVSSPLISVFTNLGAGESASISITSKATGFAANTKFTDLMTCTVVATDASGNLAVNIADGAPRSFYLTSMLKGSDPCASTNTGATTTSSSSTSKTASTSSTVTTTTKASSTSSTSSSSSSKSSSAISSTVSTSSLSSTTSKSSTTSASSSTTSSAAPYTATAITCPASNSTIYVSNNKSFLIECGIDHAAGDLSMVYVSGLQQCIDTCATTTGCVDVSLSGAACYMKSKVGSPVYNAVYGAKLLTTTSVASTTTTASSTSKAITTSTTTTSSTSKSSSTTTSACATASTVAASFNHNVTTVWLESIALVGSIAKLGTWNTSQALAMSAAGYTSSNPIWNVTVSLAAGTYLEYKFLKVNSTTGGVTWESGSNRNYTVPSSCSGVAVLNSTWQ